MGGTHERQTWGGRVSIIAHECGKRDAPLAFYQMLEKLTAVNVDAGATVGCSGGEKRGYDANTGLKMVG